jgi:Zn-dependent protease with chaperone function
MSLAWRTLLVSGALYALTNLACAVLVWAGWPLLHRAARRAGAAAFARLALGARLLPTLAAAAAALAGGAAFARHEPIGGDEPVSAGVIALGLVGAAFAAVTLLRAAAAFVASERLARTWTAAAPAVLLPPAGTAAWALDAEFPVVAVVGIRRPRLVVARSVIAGCTSEELAAIGAHETAHVQARDNVKTLWMRAVVDGLSGSRRAAALSRVWLDASEDAADDRATASGAGSVDLASALVTVARLAPGRHLSAWPAATCFYRGDGLERRVRRLLDPARTPGTPAPSRHTLRDVIAAAAGASLATGASGVARPLYDIAEWLIRYLP